MNSLVSASTNAARPLRELLREHRRNADLTLEGLAERSGVSDRTISDIERGISLGPQRRTMLALADALALEGSERDDFLASARSGRKNAVPAARAVDIEPHRLTDFTGRESEILGVVAHLAPSGGDDEPAAPVVLCGAPGVGKTSIAIEALHRCSAGHPTRLFVDLGGLDPVPLTPLQVLHSLLRQLGSEPDAAKSLGEATAAWRAAVAATPVAVLLDDAANEAQIRPVLTSDGRSAVVITSRRTLAGLEGARRLTVGPLPRGESVEFLRRIILPAQAENGDLDELAGFCDDLPLALRIAGNRLASQPTWTVEDFVRRLRSEERRLSALVAGDLGLASTFTLSYDHLAEPSRRLFRRLSLLDGGSFDPRLASAVDDLDADGAQDLLDGLAELGLVEAMRGDRYRLHDLLRLYAASRLREEEAAEMISAQRRRVRDWLLATTIAAGARFEPRPPHAAPADGILTFPSNEEARGWLMTEAEHWFSAYQAAAARGDHATVLLVADSLHWFSDLWLGWGRWHELFTTSAASARALDDPSQQARHLGYLAWAQLAEKFDPAAARATADAALDAARRADDGVESGWANFYLAWSLLHLGDAAAAQTYADASVADFARAGDAQGELQARSIRAGIRSRSDPEASIGEHRDLVAFLARAGDDLPHNIRGVTETNAHTVIASALLALRRFEDAVAAASDALQVGAPGEFPSGQAAAHRHRGMAELALGRADAARSDLTAALRLGAGARADDWLDEVRAALHSIPE
ncbi:helix-turn-helix domain-containing protein [Microbacterium sp. QXD-8]|uniref:Helix-turn-helix domain-containing protein n=1 Tax=Microbacterium psychrotolerans TaxID=3068321 RepID=A0ABU0YY03_9MICO|nr:helix-turn-helix domain-containing protein [Microbacterium sp. QXD-8]MDQ7876479.1 helix-turn-helix domain-containing protein [Microbacterium sp. QXD-8]